MSKDSDDSQPNNVTLALIRRDISYMRDEMKSLRDQFASSYMPLSEGELMKARIAQLEKVVYGFIALILLGVGGALVSGVLK